MNVLVPDTLPPKGSLITREADGFHSSGRFDRSPASLEANVHRLRRSGLSFGTRTEMRTHAFWDVLHADDGWGVYHPANPIGNDCSIEWDSSVWRLVSKFVLQLTDIQIHTKSGHLQPPCAATCVVLEHRLAGLEVEFEVAHLDLDNTPLRAKANKEECATLRDHWQSSRRKFPRRHIVFQGDINKDQRSAKERYYTWWNLTRGTDLRNLWTKPFPASGTHGKQILDVTLSTLPGKLSLLADDNSSDHRPYRAELRLP